MSDFNITSRYANALIELSEEKNNFSQTSDDIELVYNTLSSSKEFRVALQSPVIKSEKKNEILQEVFKDRVSQDTLRFLSFIVSKNREDMLFPICKRFIEIRDEKQGIVNVKVSSAVQFDETEKDSVKSKLAEYTKKDVRINYTVNENLIGGFKAQVGDTVLDASVKQQLINLRKQFLN